MWSGPRDKTLASRADNFDAGHFPHLASMHCSAYLRNGINIKNRRWSLISSQSSFACLQLHVENYQFSLNARNGRTVSYFKLFGERIPTSQYCNTTAHLSTHHLFGDTYSPRSPGTGDDYTGPSRIHLPAAFNKIGTVTEVNVRLRFHRRKPT